MPKTTIFHKKGLGLAKKSEGGRPSIGRPYKQLANTGFFRRKYLERSK
jgi:hypothetical protein